MTREEKLERYVQKVVDDMDFNTMYECVYDFIYEDLKDVSDKEVDRRYKEYFNE